MFISYDLVSEDKKNHTQTYRIVDTDFEDTITIKTSAPLVIEPEPAVIECYEKRGLNVVPNLFKCMLIVSKQLGHDMNEVLSYNVNHNAMFAPYENDIKKYLLLL